MTPAVNEKCQVHDSTGVTWTSTILSVIFLKQCTRTINLHTYLEQIMFTENGLVTNEMLKLT